MESLLQALVRFYEVEVRKPAATVSTVKTGAKDKVPSAKNLRRTFPYLP